MDKFRIVSTVIKKNETFGKPYRLMSLLFSKMFVRSTILIISSEIFYRKCLLLLVMDQLVTLQCRLQLFVIVKLDKFVDWLQINEFINKK